MWNLLEWQCLWLPFTDGGACDNLCLQLLVVVVRVPSLFTTSPVCRFCWSSQRISFWPCFFLFGLFLISLVPALFVTVPFFLFPRFYLALLPLAPPGLLLGELAAGCSRFLTQLRTVLRCPPSPAWWHPTGFHVTRSHDHSIQVIFYLLWLHL